MEHADGARQFRTSGEAYDSFMGRYSRPLAQVFADAADVRAGQSVLDIGCGPGALTGVLVDRVGAGAVAAFDPSEPFVAACHERHPDVDVRAGRAEAIPFEDARFDRALAQLVLHFVTDPPAAVREVRRVVRPGGLAAACVWDFDGGMTMLRLFWEAALAVDPGAPDEARLVPFGSAGDIASLFEHGGLEDVSETMLHVSSTYSDFDQLWSGFLAGIGPAGVYCVSLADDARAAIRDELFRRVGSPSGSFALDATAIATTGRNPDRNPD